VPEIMNNCWTGGNREQSVCPAEMRKKWGISKSLFLLGKKEEEQSR